ncbi:thiolase family protein [Taibaiella chishuiensis]|uniref:Acetyl-CoA C-acetyltransferase n=1 Tax=Taibaiella chishuiensis TaxID=1434707 RepID=A0A2P8D5D9_9BACT|nr:thiolase family protein [Taibaiella chishuiensis]PSK92435.1 acetyl-CoA C-acetyltransferase [Taibaiella chishuiensis]
MKDALIADFQRTPVGKYGGLLSNIRPDDLAAATLKALLDRNPGLPAGKIDEVILGCANQAGEDNRNIARFASLLAGMPVTVPAYTVNRLCASGMQAVINAYTLLSSGLTAIVLAGGVESMSRAPYVISKATKPFDRGLEFSDTSLGARFYNPALAGQYAPIAMGETAENIAERWHINREDQDAFALLSHNRYMEAHRAGKFTAELIDLPGLRYKDAGAPKDENVRPDTSLEKLAALKPSFRTPGTVTAGNAAGLNDGASALLIGTAQALQDYGLRPLARIAGATSVGVHPDFMGTGPVPAIEKLLAQTGLSINDIDLFEINEAFAVQVLYSITTLGIDPQRVNVNGGAIAIGHPLGNSGSRITGHLALELQRRKARYGIAAMCVGAGQGTAILIENLHY